MSWREKAQRVIAAVLDELPADTTTKEKRRALRDAYPFGLRQYTPYKVWCEEVNYALGVKVRPSERLGVTPLPGQKDLFA